MTASLTYPPPLSAPPSTATLRGLLEGLQAGAAQVPPSPPLPGGQPVLSPVRAAMETVSIAQWNVEHAATGVPVRLSIGDPLTVDELARLRDELRGRPARIKAPTGDASTGNAPTGDAPSGDGPAPDAPTGDAAGDALPGDTQAAGQLAALGFAARRAAWAAGVGAAAFTLAAAVVRVVGLDLPLP